MTRLEQDKSTLKIRCQTLQTADQLTRVEVEVLENKIDELQEENFNLKASLGEVVMNYQFKPAM